MENNLIQLVIDNSSECNNICDTYKCTSLTDYINIVGFKVFTEQFNSDSLPEHIKILPILSK